MKKYLSTQELVNAFPSWSRIRQDESIGKQFFNTLGSSIDKVQKALRRMRDNQYLHTANLDEIDLTYKVFLPINFEFDQDTTDPYLYVPVAPTVSGLIDTTWYSVTINGDNNIEDFWYNSIPNRVTLAETINNIDETMVQFNALDTPVTISGYHHLDGGRIWIETTSGTQYMKTVEGSILNAYAEITGITRKGLETSESIIFPWDMKQPSLHEWSFIDTIRVFHVEDSVDFIVKTADFNNGPYLDFYNMKYSDGRRKIDEFWDLNTVSGFSQLSRLEYITDEWESLVLGFSEKEIVKDWVLLDSNNQQVTLSDMAIQPFTQRAWTVSTNRILYCYDLLDDYLDVSLIEDRTPGSEVVFETDFDSVTRGEEMVLIPFHARPVKEILEYKIWYQTPSGNKYGLLRGVPVSYTSDYTIKKEQLITRTVESEISITAGEYGDYLFVIEVTYVDGTEQKEMKVITSSYKTPLAEIDISSLVSGTPTGIEFDADQQLWVKCDNNNCYRLNLHTDVMTIDYDRKVLYLKEKYDQIQVINNG